MDDLEKQARIDAYKAKRERRAERLRNRAAKRREEGESHRKKSDEIAKRFWMGQPILIGHHSEKRARRDQERIHDNMRKYIAKDHEANELERRAEAAEENRAIFSDDPEAIDKLQAKIDAATRAQETMKRRNKICRSKLTDEEKVLELRRDGLSETDAWRLLQPQYGNRKGYPSYSLSNNNANIRRMQERLERLQRQQTAGTREEPLAEGVTLERDPDEARIRIRFPGKPPAEIRTLLKSNGFRWSPSNTAWQRHLNGNGEYAVKCVRQGIIDEYGTA